LRRQFGEVHTESVSTVEAAFCFVSIHPSGRFVLVANYFGGSIAVLPILPDGRLGAATDYQAG